MVSISLRCGLLAALSLSLAVALQGQRPVSPQADNKVLDAARSSHGISRSDGQLIGLGGSVLARFDDEAATFTPVLGSAVGESSPLRMAARSVRRGGKELQRFRSRSIRNHQETLVEYDLGAGVTERYVARPDGIKQSFLFATRPAGSGDLAVRLAIDTLLDCEAVERADQLLFSAGPAGGLHIGKVVGIDRAGQTVTGHMRFDGQYLDLILPAEFVDAASYPLELDPIIGGIINTGISLDDSKPDIAYDLTNEVYLVVFEQVVSGTDRNIIGQRVSRDGVLVGGSIPLDVGTNMSRNPQVGNCNSLDNFFVAWQDDAGGWDIEGCSVDAATGAASAVIDVAAVPGQDEVTPDVGGDSYDSSPGLGLCLCVWDNASVGIESVVVRMQNNPPTVDTLQTVVGGPDPFRNNPAITKDGRDTGRWFVAYQHDTQFLSVMGLDFQGNPVGVPTTAGFSANDVVNHPDIDGDAVSFSLVYERNEPGLTNRRDVHAAHGVWDGSAIQVTHFGALENDANSDEKHPCISLMGSKYTAAWITPGFGGDKIEYTNLELDSLQRCGSKGEISIVGQGLTFPALVSRRSAGEDDSESGLMSYRRFVVSTTQGLLDSRLFATFGGTAPTPVPGIGTCGLGGTIGTAGGPFSPGNANFEVTLSGADPLSPLALFVVDTSGGPLQTICGAGCSYITPELTFSVALSGGGAAFPIPVPCDPVFVGSTMDAQWAPISISGAGCSLVPWIHFSDAIRMQIAN